jgi:hypothetical protein
MFTYKFIGLDKADAETPYYYGSLPVEAEVGQILSYDSTANRYVIVRMVGEGLIGNDAANQEKLAWADINRGEAVPTLYLLKLRAKQPIAPTGQAFEPDNLGAYSRRNRAIRLNRAA